MPESPVRPLKGECWEPGQLRVRAHFQLHPLRWLILLVLFLILARLLPELAAHLSSAGGAIAIGVFALFAVLLFYERRFVRVTADGLVLETRVSRKRLRWDAFTGIALEPRYPSIELALRRGGRLELVFTRKSRRRGSSPTSYVRRDLVAEAIAKASGLEPRREAPPAVNPADRPVEELVNALRSPGATAPAGASTGEVIDGIHALAVERWTPGSMRVRLCEVAIWSAQRVLGMGLVVILFCGVLTYLLIHTELGSRGVPLVLIPLFAMVLVKPQAIVIDATGASIRGTLERFELPLRDCVAESDPAQAVIWLTVPQRGRLRLNVAAKRGSSLRWERDRRDALLQALDAAGARRLPAQMQTIAS
jgi:hypothetical protein